MMRLTIDLHGKLLVMDAAKAGVLLDALASGVLHEREGWQSDAKLRPVGDQVPTVTFEPESRFIEEPEPIKRLTAEVSSLNTRWYEQYQQARKAEQLAKELQAKLDAIAGQAGASP